MTISNLVNFEMLLHKLLIQKIFLKEVMIWQNTGNVLEERFSNEGCTQERRKDHRKPNTDINIYSE